MNPGEDSFVLLPLRKIKVAPALNCRWSSTPEEIAALAESIRTTGLDTPLTVRLDDSGDPILVSGYRRHAALTLLDAEVAPCHLVDVTEKEARVKNLVENVARKDLTPPELAQRLWELSQDGHRPEQLARMTGLKKSHVRHLISLRQKLTPPVWQLFAKPTKPQIEDSNLPDEGDNGATMPARRIDWRVPHFCRVARAPAPDQMALHVLLEQEASSNVSKGGRRQGAGRPPGIRPDPVRSIAERAAWVVTREQAAEVKRWIFAARKDPGFNPTWIDGALSMFRFFAAREPLPGAGQLPDLDPT